MASGILVVCDHDNGSFKKTAAELLGKAADLAGQIGGDVTAFVAGDIDASVLGSYGATTVYQASGADFGTFNTGPFVRALQAAVEAANPAAILAPASAYNKGALPRLAPPALLRSLSHFFCLSWDSLGPRLIPTE